MSPRPSLKWASALLLSSLVFTSQSDAALIADWNFNTGTSADLTSSNGAYTFVRSVQGNDPVYSSGAISLDQFTGLFASGLNSTALPTLTQTATIYVRLRLDTVPYSQDGFLFGLLNSGSAADWAQMTLTGWTSNGTNTGTYFATNEDLGGEASSTFPAVGQYFSLAMTATAGSTSTAIQTYFNGSLANSMTLPGNSLNAFQSFALGQLKASGGVAAMTFDMVQVYDTALTAAEIAAIPEPGTVALVIGGVAFVLFRRSRSSRS